uniref:Uncharacterized protein n=1 Tax=Rhizophora mucronata TaxID=61149 RepID=A0A2P2IKQ5_RHIMU
MLVFLAVCLSVSVTEKKTKKRKKYSQDLNTLDGDLNHLNNPSCGGCKFKLTYSLASGTILNLMLLRREFGRLLL